MTDHPPTSNGTASLTASQGRAKRVAALTSIAVNIGLFTLKAVVGAITGSIALWASAADSLLDLTASIFAFMGVHAGSRPPDGTHAYGHHKFESLSSLVQLAMLFITVGVIATEAWGRLFGEPSVETPLSGVAVILVALVVDFWISRRLERVAHESGGSHALEADALHFATDVWSNIAVIIGLIAVRLGAPVGDPIAAFVVAIMVAVTALSLFRATIGVLSDQAPDADTIASLHGAIAGMPEVVEHHTMRARMVGSQIFLDVCVELDPSLTFEQSHDLSHELQDRIRTAVPEVADAVIHVEPAGHPEHQDIAHHGHGYDALHDTDQPV